MPKQRKVYKLAERRRERAEALGGLTYPIEGLDGEIVEIPYMSFWSEELTKRVYGGEYPGDGEVLRMAITETWPDEPQRLEAFERLGLQTGDIMEITTDVLRIKPAKDDEDENADGSGNGGPTAVEQAREAGKSRSSSTP